MGNEVMLNKDKFKDSNGSEHRLRELERYDFSNDWGWECKEYCKIMDIYKKTFFDAAITLSYRKYFSVADGKDELMGIGKKYAEYCQWLLRKDRKQKKRTIGAKTLLTIPDPDSESPLLQKIYDKLWGVSVLSTGDKNVLDPCYYTKKKIQCIQGETMNSIRTTLNETYKFIELSKEREWREKWKQEVSKKYLLCRYAESMLNGEFVSNLDKIRGLRTFLESAHMLGNFIPVPVGCNGPRGSFFCELRDYWDLTLLIIYNYYTNEGDDIKKIVEKVSVNEGENKEEKIEELTKRYKAWLDSFENWDNFVRKNYMRAFVSIKEYGKKKYDDNEHYGKPRELWDGHFNAFSDKEILRKKVLPEDVKQAEQFFERASFWIHERSVDMVEELEKRLQIGGHDDTCTVV